MGQEFPYQIVTFLEKEPSLNEPVYYGEYGWYPQVALKRRFKLNGINEETLIQFLKEFFDQFEPIRFTTGSLTKPDGMPVYIIDINDQNALKSLNARLIKSLGETITSRYPEREGVNYYAHITAEYNNKFVIPVEEYVNKEFLLENVWLLKDDKDDNSLAFFKII